jgi:hypothetical protein
MENQSGFYYSFLGIQITYLATFLALVFIYFQSVYTHFPFNKRTNIFTNKKLLITVFLGLTNLVINIVASYFISLVSYEFSPSFSLLMDYLLDYGAIQMFIIIVFAIYSILSLSYIKDNLFLLQPHRAVVFWSNDLKLVYIRNYLLKKYVIRPQINISVTSTSSIEVSEPAQLQGLEGIQKNAFELQNDIDNPLTPLTDSLVYFIRKPDITSLNEGIKVFNKLVSGYIKECNNEEFININDKNHISNFCDLILENISYLLEVCEIENLQSTTNSLFSITSELLQSLYENNYYKEQKKIFAFLERYAMNHPNMPTVILDNLVNQLEKSAVKIHTITNLSERDISNKVSSVLVAFSSIFSVIANENGEEMKTKFSNYEHRSRIQSLFYPLIELNDFYIQNPNSYPHDYYLVLQSILDYFVRLGVSSLDYEIKNMVFDIGYSFIRFGEVAIKSSNTDGVALVILNMDKFFEKFENKSFHQHSISLYKSYIKFAIIAFIDQSNLSFDISYKEIPKYLQNKISEFKDPIDDLIRDIHAESIGQNQIEVFEFITKLGKLMNTNFGLMFDYRTGKVFPPNDQRRFSH